MDITITRIGARAARVIRRGGAALVAAVFTSSFYVETLEGDFVCIGTADIGDGPLNAVVASLPAEGWDAAGVVGGREVVIDEGIIRIADGPRLDAASAAVWMPDRWPAAAPREQRQAALACLKALALQRAPAAGFARVAFDAPHASGIARAAQRVAQLSIATLKDWLDARSTPCDADDAMNLDDAALRASHALMGAGPGLTPSGDDLIAGMLIALHASCARTEVATLARIVRAAPIDATSGISRAFLEAAIDGEPSMAIHTAVSALIAGDEAKLPAALDAIDAAGHSSGWDMLAGALLVLGSR